MKGITKYVGLDVSKATIDVAVADEGRGSARNWGRIANSAEAVAKVMRRLGEPEQLLVCYEAGPTGYALYRQLRDLGIECMVVAPSLIPTRPGDRVKTDRRDAVRLAQLLRSGELVGVWVPGEADEALRDLVRAREDAKEDLTRAKHRLTKFLLRQGKQAPEGVRAWTSKYRQWLDGLQWEQPALRVVWAEYLHAIDEIGERVKRLEEEIHGQATESTRAPVIGALQTLRGVAEVTATTLVAEVGEFSRFEHPRQLMAYAGVVPSEYSSGASRRQGGITKAGNRHLRRVLVEAAWIYRHAPAIKAAMRPRQKGQAPRVREVAWKAQHRLHRKYERMIHRGKHHNLVMTAVARELLGFIWAIACMVETGAVNERAA